MQWVFLLVGMFLPLGCNDSDDPTTESDPKATTFTVPDLTKAGLNESPICGQEIIIFQEEAWLSQVIVKGDPANIRLFDQLLRHCCDLYPTIVKSLLKETIAPYYDKNNRPQRFLYIGSHPQVFFAGVPGSRKNHPDDWYWYYDIEAARKVLPLDIKNSTRYPGSPPPPSWATTQCMLLVHELKEAQVVSHDKGVEEENKIRAKLGQPKSKSARLTSDHKDAQGKLLHKDLNLTVEPNHKELYHTTSPTNIVPQSVTYIPSP